ncbi:MAG: hypothetical protein AABX29_00350, partial [Nanoarchaeota archaeon]
VNIMYRRAIEEDNLPWQKAIEVFCSYKGKHSTTLTDLVSLFETYYNAQEIGEKLSLEELSKASGIKWFPQVGKILSKGKVEPMYGKRQIRSPLNEEEKKRVQRAFSLDMPTTDIAYFASLSSWIVSQRFNKIGGKAPSKRFIASLGRGQKLSYQDASEIYEAQDLGFRAEDIGELIDKDIRLVDFAINNRERISSEIIEALRTIYPRRHYSTPYRQKSN